MTASSKPRLLFVPGYLCAERLYAAQVTALSPYYDCQIMVFRTETSMAGIARQIFATQPERFHYVGLSTATSRSNYCASGPGA